MVGFSISDGGGIKGLSRRLEIEAAGATQRDVVKAIRRAAPKLRRSAQAAALSQLPHRGGLASLVAGANFSTYALGTFVRITAKGPAVASTDNGQVSHPVFGGRGRARQRVRPGWFTQTMRDQAPPVVAAEVLDAMRDVVNRIARG